MLDDPEQPAAEGVSTVTDDNEPRDRPAEGGAGLARGLSMPVRRAVSRILNVGGAPLASAASPEPGPELWVVDCAVYVNGRRQPGRPAYTEALAAARRDVGSCGWGCTSRPRPASPRWLDVRLGRAGGRAGGHRRAPTEDRAIRGGDPAGAAHGPLRRALGADRYLRGGGDR